jgi:hypothetical protein
VRRRRVLLAALLASAAFAAGCTSTTEKPSTVPQTSAPRPTSDAPSTSSTTSTTTAPSAASAFGSVEELRTTLAARGICEEIESFTPLLPVTVTGLQNCEDGHLLITFPAAAERDAVLLYVANNPCTDTTYLAVADTWLVLPTPPTEVRAGDVAEILGGEVRAVPCVRD